MSDKRDRALVLIAVFKLVKAVLLLAVGLGAIGVAYDGVTTIAQRVLAVVSAGTERRITLSIISHVSGMSAAKLGALGVAAFLYAILFAVEGVGLWLQRTWAEYLTVVATGSFIPFEIYELVRDVTVPRVVTLAVNVAVVVYLAVRLKRRRATHSAADEALRT